MMEFTGTAIPLTNAGLKAATEWLDVDPETVWAVLQVETSGCGFLPDTRPVILFERHVFHAWTSGKFDAREPSISSPLPAGYGPSGATQYDRLALAMKHDRLAALYSASWGIGQVMGWNCRAAGWHYVGDMIAAFADSEDEQLLGMARYCVDRGLRDALQRHDWAGFALGYNGTGYLRNKYDSRLAAAYARLKEGHVPDVDVRMRQIRLMFAGFDPGPIDGVMGPRTRLAVADAAERGVFA